MTEHGGQPTGPRSTLERAINRARLTMSVLQKSPVAADRDRAYRLAELAFGLIGLWRQAALERQALDPATGDASVDSELSLLWWEGGVYGLGGRLANPLHHAFGATADHPQATLPVLMVSRLDAPTPALARQLVDRALAAERDGLEGRVYLDARGIYGSGPHRPGSYGAYDRDLQDTADLFRRTGRYPVELETTEARFSAPGQAPDVAVYAGWYRLRRYEDAFTFRTGALGYHIASNEAVSIHDPAEGGWCKNALERGITVTLGSIDEPYLDAFPLPQELFGLLLTGRYTLVEAYYLTTRYVSWRMVLFGDPLYNPWRGRNLVAADAIRLPTARPGWTGLPRAPTELPFLDPAAAQARLQAERQALLAGADRLLTELDTAAAGPVP